MNYQPLNCSMKINEERDGLREDYRYTVSVKGTVLCIRHGIFNLQLFSNGCIHNSPKQLQFEFKENLVTLHLSKCPSNYVLCSIHETSPF